jgi:hypothetical protein
VAARSPQTVAQATDARAGRQCETSFDASAAQTEGTRARSADGHQSTPDRATRSSREEAKGRHEREGRAAVVNAEHRDTLEKILDHPASGNVEWRQVRSLLEAVGTVTEHHNGRVEVTLGDETEVFDPPKDKDVDKQMIVDLRRMLTRAGIAPAG